MADKQQKLISHSPGGWKSKIKTPASSHRAGAAILVHHLHLVGRRDLGAPWRFLHKNTNPTREGSTSWPNHLQKPHLQIPLSLGVRILTDEFRGTHSDHSTWDHTEFGRAPNPMSGLLVRRGENTHRTEVHAQKEAETGVTQPHAKSQQEPERPAPTFPSLPRGRGPANTLILDFWPPEWWENKILLFYFILFYFGHEACGILVPQPGIEPGPPAVELWSPNHWTAREVPKILGVFMFLFFSLFQYFYFHFTQLSILYVFAWKYRKSLHFLDIWWVLSDIH